MTKTSGPIKYNGPVHVEVRADSADKAKEAARAIPGITVDESYEPIAMGGSGTWIVNATAKDVTNLPDGVTIWPKSTKQMHT